MDSTKNFDLLLGEDGDLYIDSETYNIVKTTSIKQAIQIRLKWFLNEWKYNPSFGIPYFESVFIKNPSKTHLQLMFASEINDVDGVADVEDLTIDVDEKTRIAKIGFTATTDDGISMKENLSVEV